MTTLRCVAAVAREPIYEAKHGLVTVCWCVGNGLHRVKNVCAGLRWTVHHGRPAVLYVAR